MPVRCPPVDGVDDGLGRDPRIVGGRHRARLGRQGGDPRRPVGDRHDIEGIAEREECLSGVGDDADVDVRDAPDLLAVEVDVGDALATPRDAEPDRRHLVELAADDEHDVGFEQRGRGAHAPERADGAERERMALRSWSPCP